MGIQNVFIKPNDEITKEAITFGQSAPIKKTEINSLFEKELSLCKIHFRKSNSTKNGIRTGFFCKINIKEFHSI